MNRIIKGYLVPIGMLMVLAMSQSLAQTQRLGELDVREVSGAKHILRDPTLSLLVIKTTLRPLDIESTGDTYELKEESPGEYFFDVAPGTHVFTFRITGYVPFVLEIHMPKAFSKEVSITEKVPPILGEGAFTFSSEPRGATVWFGKLDLGETPLEQEEWQAGLNRFRFELVGDDSYEILDTTIEVIADTTTLYHFEIPRKPALVTVKSDPPGATILFDGNERGQTPTLKPLEIKPGSHNIILALENHFLLDTTVQLAPKEKVTFRFHLQPEPGKLTLETVPSGATVMINGGEIGETTPLSGVAVKVGEVKIRITKAGYAVIEETLTIKPAEILRKEWTLKALPVSISISTKPEGATFTVIDQETGEPVKVADVQVTPKRSLIATGSYTITLLKPPGYEQHTADFTAEPGQPLDLKYTLKAKPGSLTIRSRPTNATIRIDRRAAGKTPKDLVVDKPGPMRIALSLRNYVSLDTVVIIEPGVMGREIILILQPEPAEVTVKSVPPGIAFTIRDSAGMARPSPSPPSKMMPLPPGTYTLQYTHVNYDEKDTTISVRAGQKVEVSILLEPKPVRVSIKSDPPGARITVNGEEAGLYLEVGSNQISLSMDRYESLDTTLIIRPGGSGAYRFKLKPLPGTAVIMSEPPGATLKVAGIDKGTTPSGPLTLPVGSHWITMELPKHRSARLRLDVEPAQIQRLVVTLEPLPGVVKVSSKPQGATVTVAGEQLGITPASIFTLAPGEYPLRLTLDHYQPIDTVVVIDPDGKFEHDFVLQPLPGYLDVASTPTGALVSVAGEGIDVTDFQDFTLNAGSYPMSVSLERFRTIDTMVSIEPEQHTPVSFTLVAAANWLRLEGEEDAGIWIDGRFAGITPLDKQLVPLGQHRLGIKKRGFSTFKGTFTIETEMETTVEFPLRVKPKIIAAGLSLALPGSGQLYWGQPSKGVAYLAAAALAGYAAYQSHSNSLTSFNAYKSYLADYDVATKSSEIDGLRSDMVESLNAMREYEVIRNSLTGLYASIWLTNVLDISEAGPVLRSLALPGSGQMSEGKRLWGSLIFAAAMGAGYLTVQNHLNLLRETALSAGLKRDYETAVDPEDIIATKAALQTSLEAIGSYETRQNIAGGFLAGIWLINLVDIVF